MINVWDGFKARNSIIHMMNIFVAAAQSITPLLVRQFLRATGEIHQLEGENSLQCTPDDNGTLVSYDTFSDGTVVNFTQNISSNTNGSQPGDSDIDINYSRYAYISVGSITISASIFSCITYFGLREYVKPRLLSTATAKAKSEKTWARPNRVILILFYMIMFLFNWLESPPLAYFGSFAVKCLCWDVKKGSDLTMVYAIGNLIGKCLVVPASQYLRPVTILYICFSCNAIAWSLGVFVPLRADIIWITAILAGLGLSSLHMNLLLYVAEFMPITGVISSMCIVFLYISGIFGPLILGNLFQRHTYMWVIYFPLVATLMQISLFFSLEVFVRKMDLRNTRKKDLMAVKDTEMVNLKQTIPDITHKDDP